MVNESYCETLVGYQKKPRRNETRLSYKANDVLSELFDKAGLILC